MEWITKTCEQCKNNVTFREDDPATPFFTKTNLCNSCHWINWRIADEGRRRDVERYKKGVS